MTQEISDKDGETIFRVERHTGGVALITDTYGSKARYWLYPSAARALAAALTEKAEEKP